MLEQLLNLVAALRPLIRQYTTRRVNVQVVPAYAQPRLVALSRTIRRHSLLKTRLLVRHLPNCRHSLARGDSSEPSGRNPFLCRVPAAAPRVTSPLKLA